jgi:hypothetical protein
MALMSIYQVLMKFHASIHSSLIVGVLLMALSFNDAFVAAEDLSCYRSHKGRISTNVLAACTFDLQLCYLLTGWEGSAADSHVFDDAHKTDFAITPGTYFLADAGFPSCDALLVPYRGICYHLQEWNQSNLR